MGTKITKSVFFTFIVETDKELQVTEFVGYDSHSNDFLLFPCFPMDRRLNKLLTMSCNG